MRISAIAPWFGGKRNLAPHIIAELGRHSAYWEPFCGSMAVLLAKPRAAMETVIDLHGDLVNLARVIQDRRLGPALYRRLRRVVTSEAIHREGKVWLDEHPITDADPVDRAYWYFVESWLGRNGFSGTASHKNGFCVRYTKGGGHPARRFASAVDSIPAWRRRLREVTVIQGDALVRIDRIADENGTAIYCDPPYLVKGGKYIHDFEDDDHGRLAEVLGRFKRARVVVSYYDHPRLDALYPGWTKCCFEVSKALANQGSRGKNDARAPEVLLINGPSAAQTPAPGQGAFSNFDILDSTP